MTAPTAPPDLQRDLPTLLTIHDIASLLRVHRTAAYARTRDPEFPDPLVISGSCYRWYTAEVLAYVETRRTPKRVPRPRRGPGDRSVPDDVPDDVLQAVPRPRAPRRAPAMRQAPGEVVSPVVGRSD
ncbi:helix-turn-helix transcriptional regulator [Nocardioides sp. T5]|uniref:helix-turn-helix transcriptional regulator n=1 Tax=Nocardioides sp. T5 TaxID=3400182 RepID=UPI003A8A4757